MRLRSRAGRCGWRIRIWASHLGCNVSFIALAALGITSPAVAVAGTAGSALLVLGNAARLLRSEDIRQAERSARAADDSARPGTT